VHRPQAGHHRGAAEQLLSLVVVSVPGTTWGAQARGNRACVGGGMRCPIRGPRTSQVAAEVPASAATAATCIQGLLHSCDQRHCRGVREDQGLPLSRTWGASDCAAFCCSCGPCDKHVTWAHPVAPDGEARQWCLVHSPLHSLEEILDLQSGPCSLRDRWGGTHSCAGDMPWTRWTSPSLCRRHAVG